MPEFVSARRRPVRVTLMGAGAVGAHAAQAASRYGDQALRDELSQRSLPGVEVTIIDYDLPCHKEYELAPLGRADRLIDATQRPDASQVIIPMLRVVVTRGVGHPDP
jgi:hypothetical protein